LPLNHALYDLSAQTFTTSAIIKQEAESQILLISAAELITEDEITETIETWHISTINLMNCKIYHSSNPKTTDINMHQSSIDSFRQQV
jgi:hypothetical protein